MKKCIISLISVFIVVLVLYVWYPDSHLMCHVVMENMPDDAEYIDMLISISKTDEEYTDFNEKNGEKFKIDSDSEIVKFSDEDFQSYTFHTREAFSVMIPFDLDEGSFYIWYYDDDIKNSDEKTSYDFFREKYRNVKFAYLDADGRIISTTNEVDIWGETEKTNIRVSIDGNKAVSDIDERADWKTVVKRILIIALLIMVGIITVKLDKRRFTKNKGH